MQDGLSQLFREVADLAPAARARYFDEHHVSPELRAEVESLLGFDSSDAAVIQVLSATAEEVLQSGDRIAAGRRCGPYRLIRLLGRGGAGEVFLAERADGRVEQRVAIKFLRPGGSPGSFVSRFLQERQILASLQHSGIARLLDAGETSEGRPYLVLDYIDGVSIDAFCQNLGIRDKLRLFLKVCEAVAYAHRNLIIHRDLKPSNILVTADGEPKLLDFGIAKILDAATDQTRTQERLLTPDYASPEQVRGAVQSTATDLYSLGAVLYHLLTGRSPHAFPTRTPEAIDAAICVTEPIGASRVNPAVPRELDFVLLKALRKEPEDRYSSVEAMADDIRAFLEFRPVRARSGNAWYRARKFVRRYRTVVAAALLTIAGLSAGLYVANHQRIIAQERFQQLHMLSAEVFDLDKEIARLPGATAARQKLVSVSVEYLEKLGAAARGDLDLAQEIGAAYLRVGRIQGVPSRPNLGEFAKAEESLRKADRFTETVLASRPNSAPAVLLSAAIAHDRMIIANSERREADAKSHAAKASERLNRLFQLKGITADQQVDAAEYYANIALYHMNVHKYDDALRYARQSIQIVDSVRTQQPRLKAINLSLIGNTLRAQGHLEEALEALQEARRTAEGLTYPTAADRALTLYAILMREARTLGQDGGVSLGRTDEAIQAYQHAVDLTDEAARHNPQDQSARDRLAACARELADLLEEKDPQRSLALFDLAIQRLREVKNNVTARRREAATLAESSYPLRRMRRFPEALARIEAAFALLMEIKDYPATSIHPESEAVVALRAKADYESSVGDRRRAVQIYEQLLTAMMAAKPDPANDLIDATKISMMCYYMAGVYRRAGDISKAHEMDDRRIELWRHWDDKLPHNTFVQRQLSVRSQ